MAITGWISPWGTSKKVPSSFFSKGLPVARRNASTSWMVRAMLVPKGTTMRPPVKD
jgi:hypothetical protein